MIEFGEYTLMSEIAFLSYLMLITKINFCDSKYSDCMKKMPNCKNKMIFDSDLKALGVDFEARPLTSKFKMF